MRNDEILPFERKPLTIRSEVEDIIFHLQGKRGYEKITPTLEDKLKRMKQCRDYLGKYGSRYKVVPMLMTDFGISQSNAYNLLNDTIDVFNVTSETKGRDMWIDIILDKIFETWRKAHAKQDFKTAAICEGRMIDVVEKFMGGQEAKLYARIQPPAIMFGFFPELTNVALPDDLEAQIKKLLKIKREKDLAFDNIEDAEIIPNAEDYGE